MAAGIRQASAHFVAGPEEAGIVFTEGKPGLRGARKTCAMRAADVCLAIYHRKKRAGPRETPVSKCPWETALTVPSQNPAAWRAGRPASVLGLQQRLARRDYRVDQPKGGFYLP
jgi:hypothetical protein